MEHAGTRKILVISDSHGRNENLRYAVGQELPFDMLIHCGDAGGDLVQILGGSPPYEVRQVRGNTDVLRAPMTLLFSLCGRTILVCHGNTCGVKFSLDPLERMAREQGADIVCFGHTHIPVIEERSGLLLLNPGSISMPHQSDGRKTYAVLQLEEGKKPEAVIRSIPDQIPARWR